MRIKLTLVLSAFIIAGEFVSGWLIEVRPYSNLFKFDPLLGYSFKSGSHKFDVNGKTVSLSVGENEMVDLFGKGDYSIVVLGDGLVAGIELNEEQRLAKQLRRLTSMNTINLSVPGYGTYQQYLSLRRWLDDNRCPDYVVAILNTTNDYFDNVQEWEGDYIPGYRHTPTRITRKKPFQGNFIPSMLKDIAKQSALLSLVRLRSPKKDSIQSIYNEKNRYLYHRSNKTPRPDTDLGDFALRESGSSIENEVASCKAKLIWIIWHDKEYARRNSINTSVLKERVEGLLGLDRNSIITFRHFGASDVGASSPRWLYPGTSHLSAYGIRQLSDAIAEQIRQAAYLR